MLPAIGFQVWGQHADWPSLAAVARRIEGLGFASLWSNDHFFPAAGAAALEKAMQNRSGLVESEPGFGGLQVWRPLRVGDPYRMVTWWTEEQAFRDYMRSEAHHASHIRTPRGEHGPRPSGLEGWLVIAWQVIASSSAALIRLIRRYGRRPPSRVERARGRAPGPGRRVRDASRRRPPPPLCGGPRQERAS